MKTKHRILCAIFVLLAVVMIFFHKKIAQSMIEIGVRMSEMNHKSN